ncbi:hypothetical protein VSDG_01972 [Cytospora chrysosperma]|uniref:Uncharacterized protein n=1 Tax=Cytospora chrysosperma TaxID=252740 RepID=A0A423WEB8_CYTCH|nr:hypothetical protein VSDG_01972 [Valsa sordida]
MCICGPDVEGLKLETQLRDEEGGDTEPYSKERLAAIDSVDLILTGGRTVCSVKTLGPSSYASPHNIQSSSSGLSKSGR